MSDRSRPARFITLALASCCATWALAGPAQARPDNAPQSTATPAAPAYAFAAGDANKAPSAATAPAYQPAIGDSLKTPDPSAYTAPASAYTAPAFRSAIGQSLKTPDPSQAQRAVNDIGAGKTPGQPVVVHATNDDTGSIALIVAIAAMLTALAAMTMISMRQTRPVMRA
jgi:hypothetical protein